MIPAVALTGGIGSGKSAAADHLRSRGVPVYDSDSMTKALYDRDPELVAELEKAFGVSLRSGDGRFDRKAFAKIIFNGRESLSRAEAIIHPAVLRDFESCRNAKASEIMEKGWCGYCGDIPFVVIESAIIMDKPLFRPVIDAVVRVDAPEDLRVRRAAARDGVPEESVRERVRAQKNYSGGVPILNDGDLETLNERTDKAFKLVYLQLKKKAEDRP
jgi:dephospho-CoA kinase